MPDGGVRDRRDRPVIGALSKFAAVVGSFVPPLLSCCVGTHRLADGAVGCRLALHWLLPGWRERLGDLLSGCIDLCVTGIGLLIAVPKLLVKRLKLLIGVLTLLSRCICLAVRCCGAGRAGGR